MSEDGRGPLIAALACLLGGFFVGAALAGNSAARTAVKAGAAHWVSDANGASKLEYGCKESGK